MTHKGRKALTANLKFLFSPIKIGPIELKNRIVMPPMVTLFAGLDWGVTDRLIDYHVERAKGGVGMIIVESTCVDPLGVGPTPRLGIFKDTLLRGSIALLRASRLMVRRLAFN